MRPRNVIELLRRAIQGRYNVLLTGSPGCGKTSMEAQAAELERAINVVMDPSISDPTDAKGMPMLRKDGSAEFVPFGDLATIYKAIESGELCALFLDNLGSATPATQAGYLGLMDKLKGKCAVIAATNRRVDKANVSGLLEPVKSRFHTIVPVDVSLEDTCTWFIDHYPDLPVLPAFFRFLPELMNKPEPTLDLVNSACPRTWEHVADLIALGLPTDIEFESLAGAVNEGNAGQFSAYRKLYESMPDLDAMIIDPNGCRLPTEISIVWAVVTGLAYRTSKANVGRMLIIAERLTTEKTNQFPGGRGEFAALLLQDIIRRVPAVQKTSEFIKFCTSSESGKLILGELGN